MMTLEEKAKIISSGKDVHVEEIKKVFEDFKKVTGNLQQESAALLTLAYYLNKIEEKIS